MWEYYIHFNYSLNPLSFYIWQPSPSCRVCRHQLPFNQISWAVRQGSSWLLLLLVLQPGLLFCWDQWAWADNTLSNNSWGTGSPLLCCGEILAVCTNVFHLSYVTGKVYTKPESAEVQIYCVSIHTHTHYDHSYKKQQNASTSLFTFLPDNTTQKDERKTAYLQVNICPMFCIFKSTQFNITPPAKCDRSHKEPWDSFHFFFWMVGMIQSKARITSIYSTAAPAVTSTETVVELVKTENIVFKDKVALMDSWSTHHL